VGHLHAVTGDVSNRLQDGTHRGPAAPQLRGKQRSGHADAESYPEDREIPEDVPRGEVEDPLAPASSVKSRALAGPADRTLQTRLADEVRERERRVLDRKEVVRQRRCE
jgi:hypothetical protein